MSLEKRRKSLRLKGYDYSSSGAYFVTLCTHNRSELFGEIVGQKMVPNEPGKMILRWYREIENRFQGIFCDQVMIMPDHIHFILINQPALSKTVGGDRCVPPDSSITSKTGEHTSSPLPEIKNTSSLDVSPDLDVTTPTGEHTGSPLRETNNPSLLREINHTSPRRDTINRDLSSVIQWYKTMTTNEYIQGVKNHDWSPFQDKLWQRGFHDHIIRDEEDLERIREYILANPKRWALKKNSELND